MFFSNKLTALSYASAVGVYALLKPNIPLGGSNILYVVPVQFLILFFNIS